MKNQTSILQKTTFDRSHRIGRKKDGHRPRPIIVKLMRYKNITPEKMFLQVRES